MEIRNRVVFLWVSDARAAQGLYESEIHFRRPGHTLRFQRLFNSDRLSAAYGKKLNENFGVKRK